ncbi:hypothetical protein [Polaribacter porphyrae]|uniref:Uncharacterized protein n=1 Tax=Polaribacter porphyrae TaxID=1137780 RepID=A0A2S7WSN6_9FLAO|nr:hypothetical protein [Polaribacter porphyrae]PQJ80604.1 hypothetical protein BTO18_16105 [Polaribacter porphyrae]
MKNLFFIALFSLVFMSSTTVEKEIKSTEFKNFEIEEAMFFGCGSEGNDWYDIYREQGDSHREARAKRRAFVRKCRGGGWKWVFGVYTFDTIGL